MDRVDAAYERLGVRSDKSGVVGGLQRDEAELFPGAFCHVIPDLLSQDPRFAVTIHSDGVGTKSLFAYLLAEAHDRMEGYRQLAWDSTAMNVDDVAAAGFFGPYLLSNVVNRNLNRVDDEACRQVIGGYQDVRNALIPHGIDIVLAGGETADLGDLVRTITVDSTVTARAERRSVVNASNIGPDLTIIGLGVVGTAAWESSPNSGVMSNGISLLRHHLLRHDYTEIAEAYDPALGSSAFVGPYLLTDAVPGLDVDFGTALSSPTRVFAPLLKRICSVEQGAIRGIIHVTGGGLTKSTGFGEPCVHLKDNLFELPLIQRAVMDASELSTRDVVPVLNMGHGIELFVEPSAADDVLAAIKECDTGIDAQVIGQTLPGNSHDLVVEAEGGTVRLRRSEHGLERLS